MSYRKQIRIGTWHERQSRRVQQCPSYYAADYEILETEPGEYPVYLEFVSGYTVPMPYYLRVAIPSTRVEGRLYSGFGGLNFSSREMPKEKKSLAVSPYAYNLLHLIEKGLVTLDEGVDASIVDWQSNGIVEWSQLTDTAAVPD